MIDHISYADVGDQTNPASRKVGISGMYQRVRNAILNGELEQGSVVSQVQLASELGVSRTPLREVLRLLEREGLVEAEHNRRIRISPMSLPELDEIYAARIVLEALALRLTVPALTENELGVMRFQWEEMCRFAEAEDYESWLPPHERFHGLARCHAGTRLTRELRILSDHAERYRRVYTTQSPQAWALGVVDHCNVLEACERRDLDAAAAAVAIHLGRTALSTVALLSPTYEPARIRGALLMVTGEAPRKARGANKRQRAETNGNEPSTGG